MKSRRKLIVALGTATLVAPLSSLAQSAAKIWRVGFLALRPIAIAESNLYYGPFRQGMRELGYVEGKNLLIEWRSAEGNAEHLALLAQELVNLKVDVIVTAGEQANAAAQKATTTIPIVMGNTGDPVELGFIKSLAKPGGNITGLANLSIELRRKHLEMLKSMVPGLARVGVMQNPDNPVYNTMLTNIRMAAQKLGVTVLLFAARDEAGIENAFVQMAREKVGAVIVGGDGVLNQQVKQIAGLAAKYKLPSIARIREYAEAGGLMSYGSNLAG